MMAKEPEQTEYNFKREMLAALPNLRAFAISLIRSRDRADDLVQDTIMKAWAKQESFQPGTNMRAWLVTILRNEFYSQILQVRPRSTGYRRGLHLAPVGAARTAWFGRSSGFSYGTCKVARRSARSDLVDRRLGLCLRRSSRDLRVPGWHDQEPCQPRAIAPAGTSRHRKRKRVWS